ncbi:MAG: SPASM domain-containing protein [Alphaproteobacteria bacterium]|nr:SPASM domain-containing protein [Alphaproteobacteria bacterium]
MYPCRHPFETVEIHRDGEVYFCCPAYNKNSIGNVYKDSFKEIWNSDKAKEIRSLVIKGDYRFCDLGICGRKLLDYAPASVHVSNPPKQVKFCHDKECCLACGGCRKSQLVSSSDDLVRLDSKIEGVYLPILEGADSVDLAGDGDPFASRHYRTLIKRIVETYPDMKFSFHTNGVLASRQMLEELGVVDRLDVIQISFHSSTKQTWQNFTRGRPEQYDALMENIKYLSELRKSGRLPTLQFNFVITNFNYRELVPFIRLAKSFSANRVEVWGYRNRSEQTEDEAARLGVFHPVHPEYDKLREILRGPVFADPEVYLYPEIKKIRDEA